MGVPFEYSHLLLGVIITERMIMTGALDRKKNISINHEKKLRGIFNYHLIARCRP